MSIPSRGSDQFIVRLPDGMRERIKKAAADNGRSMNAELVHTLEQAYPPPPPEPESLNKDLLRASMAIAERWSELLMAIGQDPESNPELNALRAKVHMAIHDSESD